MKNRVVLQREHSLPRFRVAYATRIAWSTWLLVGLLAQLSWAYSGGMGSLSAPYLIASADDLIELGQTPRDYDKHFLLTEDIDLSGYTFDKAVIAPTIEDPLQGFFSVRSVFSGTINGDGHVIRNLAISGTENLALIGQTGSFAQVFGVGVVDADIMGTDDNVGALAGVNQGTISNSYSIGSVKGRMDVGGLVGNNHGTIGDCFSRGKVSGNDVVGGLVGKSGGDVINSYSTCRVSAIKEDSPWGSGGFIGSSGNGVSNCFWDIQTSGFSDPKYGTGLNTEQMFDINTYLGAGWDFLGETVNGCRETWLMPEAGGYPVLSVFYGSEPSLPANCGVTLGQCTLPLDANDILWDSTASFTPQWDSLALSRISQNPAQHSENDTEKSDVFITVSGKIDVLYMDNLFAIDARNSAVCQALDGHGNNIMLRHINSPFEPKHAWEVLDSNPEPFTLHLWLDPDQAVPPVLSQLDFYVYALYAQPLTTFDIPFEPMDDWIELLPGFRMIIETALSEDGECEYLIKEEISKSSHHVGLLMENYEEFWLETSWELTDRDLIYSRNMIDSQGKPTSRSGGRRSSGGHSSDGVLVNTLSGTWSDCSGIEVIRYTIAVKPRRFVVPLTLTDIPVLGL